MKIRTLALATGLLAGLPLVGTAQGGGPLDTRFGDQGNFRLDLAPNSEWAQDVVLDSQGRIYVAFRWRDPSFPDPVWWPGLLRLAPGGTPDLAFGTNGVWIGDAGPAVRNEVQVVVDAQDRPLVGWTVDTDPGPTEDFAWVVRRLSVAGATDLELSVQFAWGESRSERLTDLLVLADGRVLAAGSVDFAVADTDFGLAVWTDDGAGGFVLDTGFDGDGRATVPFDLPNGPKTDQARVALEEGDMLWVAGTARGEAGASKIAVARLDLATGNLDGTFGGGGTAVYDYTPLGGPTWFRHDAYDMASRPAGGLVLAGLATETSSSLLRAAAFAIDATGSVDLTWGAFGWYVPDLRYPGFPFDSTWGDFFGVAIDDSGRTLLVGDLGNPSDTGQSRALAIRLTASGGPDFAFSSDGVELYAFESGAGPYLDGFDNVVPTDDGKLALAGGWTYGETGGTPRSDFDLVVARIVVEVAS